MKVPRAAHRDTEPAGGRWSLTGRCLAAFALLLFGFKALTVPGHVAILGRETQQNVDDLAIKWAAIGFIVVTLSFLAVAWIFRPIERLARSRSPSAAEARAGFARLRTAPALVALVWALEWVAFFASASLLEGRVQPAAMFSIVAAGLAAPPVAYLVAANLLASEFERLVAFAPAAGEVTGMRSSLRGQAMFFALTIALAPATYIASIGMAARDGSLDEGTLWPLVGLCLVAVAAFAALCAALFARSISLRIRSMTDLVRTVAREGTAFRVGRLPIEHYDEIGALADGTNAMIERLVGVERKNAAIGASLSELNHSLERRVEERTDELASANARLAEEMNTRLAMEVELRQAQKLEAIGRLAAGVSHEINTPVQFVADSLHFIDQSVNDILVLLETKRELRRRAAEGAPLAEIFAESDAEEERADLPYLVEHLPKATTRALEGLDRIAHIVRAMKEFAHPDHKEMAAADLNQAIRSTLVIARNEYKYVADVHLDLGELPPVTCHLGEVNQAVLNIVVNAAHAIADKVAGTEAKGRIQISTRLDGAFALVSIEDDGGGISEAHRERVFEPFFTTKEVGRGTGQGLAIARAVVVDKHGGEIAFETRDGEGTTFHIRLPIEGARASSEKAAA